MFGRATSLPLEATGGTVMKGQRHRRLLSFTLIELLVVIAIIAILAAVLTPAVTDALTRGKMTGTMNNGRSIYLSLFSRDTEDPVFQTGSPFPTYKDGNTVPMYFQNSTDYFKWVVTSGVMTVDFSFFSAPDIPPYKSRDPQNFDQKNNAWCITADVAAGTPDGVPLLFTRNLVIDKLNEVAVDKLSDQQNPFRKKGVVVVTKGGSSMVLKETYLTNNFNAVGASNDVLRPAGSGKP
jgi:prepilin-type N-terminal cleavage/methylation domain-containing protein